MSYTNGLDKPTDYFNTVLYTGNGGTQSITGVGFQPDWVWLKSRSVNGAHHLINDVVRGADKGIFTNLTTAEITRGVSSFDSDGFSFDDDAGGDGNASGSSQVAWNWLAGGTASSNSSGSITSSVSANTTSGFSIVSYTGTGSNATVGHGLGVAPKMIICKGRSFSSSAHWLTYHEAIGNTSAMKLNLTSAKETTHYYWNNTSPTSSTFSLGASTEANTSSATFIAYCFNDVKGYSKFGSYTGNGNADGTFIYTGFKPAWVMIKRSNSSGEGWHIYDNKRNTFNLVTQILTANTSGTEATGSAGGDVIDMLSQGFKCRGTHGAINGSGNSYIYMAFAENPFVTSTGIPSCAR